MPRVEYSITPDPKAGGNDGHQAASEQTLTLAYTLALVVSAETAVSNMITFCRGGGLPPRRKLFLNQCSAPEKFSHAIT